MQPTVGVDEPDLEVSPDPHVSADWPADLHRCEAAARKIQPDTPSQPRRCVVHLAFSTAFAMLEFPRLPRRPVQPRLGDTTSALPGPQPCMVGTTRRLYR